ncbi:MAG: hypothetical protein E7316_05010 [Clostridiales bacterium]|nr:hypothetical protein [Clostridiales bacterium]
MAEQRPCRCLLMASGQEDMARLVAEYIATLPEESRVPDAIYRRRLALCEGCEALLNGTCARCGCYVEARAAKRGLACPDTPARWTAEKES